MRSLWKGSISFGLVNIPVRLYTATEEKNVRFNQLHRECRTPIKYQKVCPRCGREVAQDEIVRGYEYERNRFVIMEEQDFENLPLPTARQVEILGFVQLSEIDPIYYDKSYYLEPDQGAEKAYALLRRAMREKGRVAVAKVAIRSREALACVRVYGQALVLETMFYPDEIRSVERLAGITEEPALSEREVAMAAQLIDNLTEPFDPAKYHDEYREALLAAISRKVQGEAPAPQAPAPAAGKVIDLMQALEASLRATARDKRSELGVNGAAAAGSAAGDASNDAGAAGDGAGKTGDTPAPIRVTPKTIRQAAREKVKDSKETGTGR